MQTHDERPLQIREAEPADASSLREFVLEVTGQTNFLGSGPDEYNKTEGDVQALLHAAQEVANKVYLIALMDNRIVGLINFTAGKKRRSSHVGEFGMSVDKDFWGQGIGSQLIDALIKWANESEVVKKINLEVRTDNLRAINLYQRKGFVHEGTTTRSFCIDGQFYDCHRMGLEI